MLRLPVIGFDTSAHITAEEHGEQERCLREIASVTGLATEIISYDDFCNRFVVGVSTQ